jgi:hypothetical protein
MSPATTIMYAGSEDLTGLSRSADTAGEWQMSVLAFASMIDLDCGSPEIALQSLAHR